MTNVNKAYEHLQVAHWWLGLAKHEVCATSLVTSYVGNASTYCKEVGDFLSGAGYGLMGAEAHELGDALHQLFNFICDLKVTRRNPVAAIGVERKRIYNLMTEMEEVFSDVIQN